MKFCGNCGRRILDENIGCPDCRSKEVNQNKKSLHGADEKTSSATYSQKNPQEKLSELQKEDISPSSSEKKNSKVKKGNLKSKLSKLYVVIPVTVVITAGLTFGMTKLIHKHNWGPATCFAPAQCYGCYKYKDSKLGNHDWESPNCVEPAKCRHCNAYRDDKLGNHKWETDDYGNRVCEFCYIEQGN